MKGYRYTKTSACAGRSCSELETELNFMHMALDSKPGKGPTDCTLPGRAWLPEGHTPDLGESRRNGGLIHARNGCAACCASAAPFLRITMTWFPDDRKVQAARQLLERLWGRHIRGVCPSAKYSSSPPALQQACPEWPRKPTKSAHQDANQQSEYSS